MNYDRLDNVAARVAKEPDGRSAGVLSTGERLYVYLAANRPDLLADCGYTIVEAIARIAADGGRAVPELVNRWQYAGNPVRE